MDTTLGRFLDVFGPLVPMREHQRERGRHLHATGQPYSACTTDAERDGWCAAMSAAIDAGRGGAYVTFADAEKVAA